MVSARSDNERTAFHLLSPRSSTYHCMIHHPGGKTELFSLTVDNTARGQIAKGDKLCLVIVSADVPVAATFFGASKNDNEKSPKLTLDLPWQGARQAVCPA